MQYHQDQSSAPHRILRAASLGYWTVQHARTRRRWQPSSAMLKGDCRKRPVQLKQTSAPEPNEVWPPQQLNDVTGITITYGQRHLRFASLSVQGEAMKREFVFFALAAATACGCSEEGVAGLGGGPGGSDGNPDGGGLTVLAVEESIALCREWCLCERPNASDLTRCEEDCKTSLFSTCELLYRAPVYQCAIDVACDDPFSDCEDSFDELAFQQCNQWDAYEPVQRCTLDNCDGGSSSPEADEECRASCGHCAFLCEQFRVEGVSDVDQVAQRDCYHQCEVELLNDYTAGSE